MCIFQPDRCVADIDEELHQVTTDKRGTNLIKIKEETNDDSVKSKWLNLYSPDDAAAQEIWYNQVCFRSAERTCKPTESDSDVRGESLVRAVADVQICSYVRNELLSGNKSLTMNDFSDKYVAILEKKKK